MIISVFEQNLPGSLCHYRGAVNLPRGAIMSSQGFSYIYNFREGPREVRGRDLKRMGRLWLVVAMRSRKVARKRRMLHSLGCSNNIPPKHEDSTFLLRIVTSYPGVREVSTQQREGNAVCVPGWLKHLSSGTTLSTHSSIDAQYFLHRVVAILCTSKQGPSS